MYKAQLTHWHGEGLPKAVAVKTLKGAVTIRVRACNYVKFEIGQNLS